MTLHSLQVTASLHLTSQRIRPISVIGVLENDVLSFGLAYIRANISAPVPVAWPRERTQLPAHAGPEFHPFVLQTRVHSDAPHLDRRSISRFSACSVIWCDLSESKSEVKISSVCDIGW